MDFERIVRDISALNLNLYSLALYTPDGIQSHRFQPCSNCCNSYSVAKVFILTALGMLCDEGRLQVNDPIGAYLDVPDDPRWKRATIEHAITHKLGFDEGFLDIDTEDTTLYPSDDYLSIVFSRPLIHEPGTHEQYSDAAYYLLSRLVSRISGESPDVFLARRLLNPLGFHEAAWSRCPLHYAIGATGLYISAQDMVKLGALYLEDGVWQGNRILSPSWVQTAISRGYELHPLHEGHHLIGKWGMYGQLLAFSPEKRFALALHAHMSRDESDILKQYLCSL